MQMCNRRLALTVAAAAAALSRSSNLARLHKSGRASCDSLTIQTSLRVYNKLTTQFWYHGKIDQIFNPRHEDVAPARFLHQAEEQREGRLAVGSRVARAQGGKESSCGCANPQLYPEVGEHVCETALRFATRSACTSACQRAWTPPRVYQGDNSGVAATCNAKLSAAQAVH